MGTKYLKSVAGGRATIPPHSSSRASLEQGEALTSPALHASAMPGHQFFSRTFSFDVPWRMLTRIGGVCVADPVALNQSEYYVLAAAVGHALGPNDPMLGQLYLNAG